MPCYLFSNNKKQQTLFLNNENTKATTLKKNENIYNKINWFKTEHSLPFYCDALKQPVA